MLIEHAALRERIRAIAASIATAHPQRLPLFVSVIEGARVFARHLREDLSRRLSGQPSGTAEIHEIRARSYGAGTVSSGSVRVEGADDLDVRGRDVVLLEDIVDTGHTVARVSQVLRERGASSVDVATLLTKPARREVDVELRWVGFEIDDHFVIGFGMDIDGRYRELCDIVIYDAALERA